MKVWRAISLWQPWASLVAHRLKKIETRHWSTNWRGTLLIHAAKNESALPEPGKYPFLFPLGAYVAVVDLTDVKTTEAIKKTGLLSLEEMGNGNYDDGRFSWFLSNIRPLKTPVPAKGHQGFWMPPWHEQQACMEQLGKVAT